MRNRVRDFLTRRRKPDAKTPVRFRVTASARVTRADGTFYDIPSTDMGLIPEEQARAMVGDKWQPS